MGCFMDADALTLQRVHSETFFNELATAMEENEASRWHGANFNLDQASGLNLVAFETGFGDGVYPSYWGLASDGSVACLLSDFGLLE